MALKPLQVIQTFDYYNTNTLLPGYTVPGYEDEQNITRAHYSTDFSSNPIGSKIDFYNHLNNPCLSISQPNPVFDIPKSLSALDPQWFNGWWDNAMFYSHPLVTSQLQQDNPSIYQAFSDSVGTITYAPNTDNPSDPTYGNDAISSALNAKIPNRLLSLINGLNSNIQTNFNNFTPAGVGPLKGTFLQQVNALKNASTSLQSTITGKVGPLKNKLPFSVTLIGNLATPPSWSYTYNIEGVSSTVNKVNGIISAPGKLLSESLTKLSNLVPKINLPSISKLVGAIVPNMPAVSNIIGDIQAASTATKSVLSQAQGALGAVTSSITPVLGTINSVTGQIAGAANLTIKSTANLQNINKVVVQDGGVTAALTIQSPSSLTSLTNNSMVIINNNTINAKGNSSVTNINSIQYPPNS